MYFFNSSKTICDLKGIVGTFDIFQKCFSNQSSFWLELKWNVTECDNNSVRAKFKSKWNTVPIFGEVNFWTSCYLSKSIFVMFIVDWQFHSLDNKCVFWTFACTVRYSCEQYTPNFEHRYFGFVFHSLCVLSMGGHIWQIFCHTKTELFLAVLPSRMWKHFIGKCTMWNILKFKWVIKNGNYVLKNIKICGWVTMTNSSCCIGSRSQFLFVMI